MPPPWNEVYETEEDLHFDEAAMDDGQRSSEAEVNRLLSEVVTKNRPSTKRDDSVPNKEAWEFSRNLKDEANRLEEYEPPPSRRSVF